MPNDLEGLWTTADPDEEDDDFTMSRHQHTEQNLRIDRSIDVAEALLAIREMTESEAMVEVKAHHTLIRFNFPDLFWSNVHRVLNFLLRCRILGSGGHDD